MRKILLTVAAVVFLYAIVVAAAPQPGQLHVSLTASQPKGQEIAQASPAPEIQIFLGTITKVGNRFVFSNDVSRTSYQLDDQETASKFDEKKVKVTGTLDASHNIIRVQSIEATA
jgi:hypothetical protein